MAYARIARICGVVAAVCAAVHAVAYRAYAIRPYKWRKPHDRCLFPNTTETTFDVGKTMSYAEKIMSDVIQTTSDIIYAIASL